MVKINPNLAAIALRQKHELGFVIWSLLRHHAIQNNLSSHYSKKEFKNLLQLNGLTYNRRHIARIIAAGAGIFWRVGNSKIYLVSFDKVASYFEAFTKPCDLRTNDALIFVDIELSKSIEAIRAEIYFAWFAQFQEKIISRATLTDIFGLSPAQQRAYEKKLGARLLVKTNYAHINGESYADNPQYLPEHHFTIHYRQEINLNQDIEAAAGYGIAEKTAYQYQLPNTFFARPNHSQFIPVTMASNRAKRAIRRLFGLVTGSNPTKRTYWLKRRDFERFAALEALLRVAWQGKKSLWILGQYF